MPEETTTSEDGKSGGEEVSDDGSGRLLIVLAVLAIGLLVGAMIGTDRQKGVASPDSDDET